MGIAMSERHDLVLIYDNLRAIGLERRQFTYRYRCAKCNQEFEHVFTKLSRHWGGGQLNTLKDDRFRYERCPVGSASSLIQEVISKPDKVVVQ